jgi:RNA polymerase sigma factor (sigma-70 family)
MIVQVLQMKKKQDLRSFFSSQYQKLVNLFRAKYENMSQMEVEDIVSDLMTDLLDKVDISGQIENIGAYIYRAAQNRVIDYLRRRKKTVSLDETVDDFDDSSFKTIIPEPGYDMQAELDSSEIRERLVKALDHLKPDQRAVWIATELDGALFRELAERWGLPIGTLLARKHRAVAALQKELHDLKNY